MKTEELVLKKRRILQEEYMFKIHSFRKEAKTCMEENNLESVNFEGLARKQRKIKRLKKQISLLNWILETEEEVD